MCSQLRLHVAECKCRRPFADTSSSSSIDCFDYYDNLNYLFLFIIILFIFNILIRMRLMWPFINRYHLALTMEVQKHHIVLWPEVKNSPFIVIQIFQTNDCFNSIHFFVVVTFIRTIKRFISSRMTTQLQSFDYYMVVCLLYWIM